MSIGRRLVVAAVVTAGACPAHAGSTIYVDAGAPLGGDGSSWATAYRFLQDAIANAGDGTEIRVAGGTYTPDQDESGTVTAGDREAAFVPGTGVTLLGGFAGIGHPNPDERSIALYASTLSGDLLGDDGPGFANNNDNSYHVVRAIGASQSGLIDGFTVTAGNADSGPLNNTGGAVQIRAGASPTFQWVVFSSNTASIHGGAAEIQSSTSTFRSCAFLDNTTTSNGGAMFLAGFGNPTLIECYFSGNTANRGGALGGIASTAPQLINCLLTDNQAGLDGGAVWAANGMVATLINSTIARNTAPMGGGVASVDATNESLVIATNCVLWDNQDADGQGEAAQLAFGTGAPIVNYSAIEGLTGLLGGAGNIGDDPEFVDPDNGDFRLHATSPCIDAGDGSAVPGGVDTDLDGNPRFLDIPETPDTGAGDPPIVDMGAYESLGGGCLALTILETLCHPDGTTFTLNVEGLSACTGDIVMATFTASDGAVGEDLCLSVIVNGEQGGFCCTSQVCVPVPDCSEALGDLDGDGVVGVLDLALLLGQIGPCSGTCPADLDRDGFVGVTDLLIVLGSWD